MTRFFDHVAQCDRLYRALLGKKGSPWFAARIQDSVTTMTAAHLPDADDLVATILAACSYRPSAGGLPTTDRSPQTNSPSATACGVQLTENWR